jgi:K+-sensing histidine kinase KdpD
LNNLLDLKKIESGFIKVRRTQMDALSLLKQCHADFLPSCQSKSQRLLLELPFDLPPILADAEQIHQVLINLLGNAHKFTPIGGTITLQAEAQNSHVRIEIRDTGRGIRTEDRNVIFEAFRQAEREEGPGMRGTGLGLSIVKGIIELHEGEIGVESEYGRGSTFHFTLPVWEDHAELVAYVTDRLHEAKARKAPCSLLLLRSAHTEVPGTLDSVMQTVNRTLRASDSGLLSRVHGYIAYVLETNALGVTAALERLAGESLTDVPEFAVRKLTTAQDAAEWISRGPERWSALRVVSDNSILIENPSSPANSTVRGRQE